MNIKEELEKYLRENNCEEKDLINVLHFAQSIDGFLSREILHFIAQKLQISFAKVYGVATFYSYFSLEQKGKCVINICLGTACFVKGAEKILDELKSILGIELGETTKDGVFTLDSLRCIGACGLAPVIEIDGQIYGNVKPEEVKEIIEKHKKGETNE